MGRRAESCLGSEGWWWQSALQCPHLLQTRRCTILSMATRRHSEPGSGEAGTQGWSQLMLGQAPAGCLQLPAPSAPAVPGSQSAAQSPPGKAGGKYAVPPTERHCLRLPACAGMVSLDLEQTGRSNPRPPKAHSLARDQQVRVDTVGNRGFLG